MGYSERHCHICGVSFNISRIRTEGEPRSHAWHQVRHRHLGDVTKSSAFPLSFVHSSFWQGDCPRDSGCKVVFREDAVRQQLAIRRRQRGEAGDQDDDYESLDGNHDEDADFVPDPVILAKIDADEALAQGSHESPGRGFGVEGGEADMEYEYDLPHDSCSEFESDQEMTTASDNEDDEDRLYESFTKTFGRNFHKSREDGFQETLLPLYCQSEDQEDGTASMHEGESSSASASAEGRSEREGGNEQEDVDEREERNWRMHERMQARRDHERSKKFSHYQHPLSEGLPAEVDKELVWEHIAGPGCVLNEGYNGAQISEEEMARCNTFQCLVQREEEEEEEDDDDDDDDDDVKDEDDEEEGGGEEEEDNISDGSCDKSDGDSSEFGHEPWQRTCRWELTGLGDDMPSRDMSDPVLYHPRRSSIQIDAENVNYAYSDEPKGMPFHPTCFEIYRRVSLERTGNFDIEALGSWYKVSLNTEGFDDFPRNEAVARGNEQSWQHNPGDEYLAADPVLVPGLIALLSPEDRRAKLEWGSGAERSAWTHLSTELVAQVLGLLNASDLGRMILAIPSIRNVASRLIVQKLKEGYPYLWEISSETPPYQWVGITGKDIRLLQQLDCTTADEQHTLSVLDGEGWPESRIVTEQSWSDDKTKRSKAILAEWDERKNVPRLSADPIALANFAVRLDDGLEAGRVKGLQNRARIWDDCQEILNQIEAMREEGVILGNGRLRPDMDVWGRD